MRTGRGDSLRSKTLKKEGLLLSDHRRQESRKKDQPSFIFPEGKKEMR